MLRNRELEHQLRAEVKENNLEKIRQLLLVRELCPPEKRFDVNAPNKHGVRALCRAAARNFEIVKLLVDAGADVNLGDKHHERPLHWAARNRHESTPLIIDYLLEKGADLHAKCKDGESVLHISTKSDRWNLITLFLDKGCCPNWMDNSGRTAVHFAASGGYSHSVKILAEYGADLDTRDKKGKTPLYWAIRNWYQAHRDKHMFLEVVNILLQLGANRDIKDNENKNPLDYSDSELLRLFENHKEDSDKLKTFNLTKHNCSDLRKMGNVKLSQDNVYSLYDIYQEKNPEQLAAKCANISKKVLMTEWMKEYPYHGEELIEKLKTGINRSKAKKWMQRCFFVGIKEISNSDHEEIILANSSVYYKICAYLNTEDIKNIVKASFFKFPPDSVNSVPKENSVGIFTPK